MTRKFLAICVAAMISTAAIAQPAATSIPPQVLTAFQAVYPSVSNATWNEEAGYFLPTFTVNGVQTIGYIDLKGHYIQTITKVRATDLPAAATAYITQNYAGAQISDAGKIEFPTGHAPRYYAKANGKQLLFDETGKFIKITESTLKQ